MPSVSQDGRLVAFVEPGGPVLAVQDVLTGEARRFTFSLPVSDPQLSPDGGTVFFTRLHEDCYFTELWSLDLASGDEYRLTSLEQGDVYNYAVAPDSSCLAFTAFHDDGNRQQLFLLPLAEPCRPRTVDGEMPRLKIDDFPELVFSPDSRRLLFAYERTIYIVDLDPFRMSGRIEVGKPVYFLSSSTGSVLFVSLHDDFYQVFSADTETGELEQLTFGGTHKLLPVIGDDGFLYYLDAGETLNARKLSELLWLVGNTSASIFRDYRRNDWGRIAWGDSYALEFLITAYEEYADEYFLQEFARRAEAVLASMDVERGVEDYRGVSAHGWSATRYSYDKDSRMRVAVHSAMVGVPLAEFVRQFRESGRSDPELVELAGRAHEALRLLARTHEDQWVEHSGDPLDITEEGEGYCISPRGSPARDDGVNLPFNQQNRLGTMLVKLYELDGEAGYLDRALKMARVFRRHLVPDGEGYRWPYWWGKGLEGWAESEALSTNRPSSSGHRNLDAWSYATMELEFVASVSAYGVFDEDAMTRLVETYLDPESAMGFDRLKAGALLAAHGTGIPEYLRGLDVLGGPWQSVPYLSRVLGEQGDATWRLKRASAGNAAKAETVFEGESLLSFVRHGSALAVVSKERNEPYQVALLAGVE